MARLKSGFAADAGFELGAEGFSFEGEQHSYADVKHLACFGRRAGNKFLGTHYMRLQLWVAGSRTPIVVENALGLGFTADRVARTYLKLAEKTFAHRAEIYLNALRSEGAFDYADVTFFRDGSCQRSGIRHDLRTWRVRREDFQWVFSSRTSPLQFTIDGETDPDVMDHIFRTELELDVA